MLRVGCRAPTEDSAKRSVFTGIQWSSTIAANGYRAMPVQTGYGSVMAQRVDDVFATCAKEDGKVVSVDEDMIVIEYKSGKRKSVDLGLRYGRSEGTVYPHNLVTKLKEGQKFKAGDPISWNDSFFEDTGKGSLEWKSGVLTTFEFIEGNHTFEDSNSMSPSLAEQMVSKITKVKSIVEPFDHAIHNLVKEGRKVEFNDILCAIEKKTSEDSLFGEDATSLLNNINSTRKVGYHGTVTNIEVYYHGDKSKMDSSVRKLADQMDKKLKQKAGRNGSKVTSAQVDGSFRIDGNPLQENHVAILVYITFEDSVDTSDKFVAFNQLKTTCAHIHDPKTRTESGIPIDMKFGVISVSNRIVESSELMGVACRVQYHYADVFYAHYKE